MTMEDLLHGESASLSATAASACFVTLCNVDEAEGDVAESGIWLEMYVNLYNCSMFHNQG